MKISYNWLKSYLDFNLQPDELSGILTDIGLEVEGITAIEGVKGGLRGVVVGEVVACEKHPNADKLKITKVNIGETELPIVCGAPNVEKGQKVLVATVGCTIYPIDHEELKIKKAKIRGEVSEGMICAEDELGLGKDHHGIMILDNDARIGMPASEHLKLESDYIIEIGLTPNRTDAMSHLGVARDLKAYLSYHNGSAAIVNPPTLNVPKSKSPIQVSVEDKVGCPKYFGLVIRDVTVSDSPDWLRNRLVSIGLTPINNIVDITNFVLHESGQPIHAFDANIVDDKVVVRRAKSKERFITLDGVVRELTEDDLMICNNSEPMCIAGVFGGYKSGVGSETNTVFLESAWFDPISIRKTAKYHGLKTDASFRFERGVDPNITEFAIKRAALLIQEIAGGKPEGGISVFEDKVFKDHSIEFNPDAARRLIGDESIDDETFRRVFTALDMEVKIGGSSWLLLVPPYRFDVTRQADLIEEFLRIYGLNEIPVPPKVNAAMSGVPDKNEHRLRNSIADILTASGFSEVVNNSLTSQSSDTFISGQDNEHVVNLVNPLSNELTVLRRDMLGGLLENLEYNQNRQNPDLKLYEFGKIYDKTDAGFKETQILSILVSGKDHTENWGVPQADTSYYVLKGYIEKVLNALNINTSSGRLRLSCFTDGLGYYVGKEHLGDSGWIKSEIQKRFGVKNKVFFASFNWDKLMKLYTPGVKFNEVSKFPSVRRDLSLLIDNNITFDDIRQVSFASEKKFLKGINLFDVYEGDKIAKGKKSYAVSFSLRDEEKTLTDKQVDKVMDAIVNDLKNKLSATLR